jgi:hypothetical protein
MESSAADKSVPRAMKALLPVERLIVRETQRAVTPNGASWGLLGLDIACRAAQSCGQRRPNEKTGQPLASGGAVVQADEGTGEEGTSEEGGLGSPGTPPTGTSNGSSLAWSRTKRSEDSGQVDWHKSFLYQAESWTKARRVVAKVEFQLGELFPRVGFIVTNLKTASRAVVRLYHKRGTAE